MSPEMQIALVGVLGTLGGVFLGWVLNNLSQRGKLNIYISSFYDSFQHNEVGCMVSSSSVEQTEYYSYKLVIELYNSSDKTKIMRNITVVFSDGKNDLFKSVPNDDSTKKRSGPMFSYDRIGPMNISPKSITQLNLHGGVWQKNDGLNFIWKTTKVYFTYLDENNKRKKINIKHEIYSEYFNTHKAEKK